MLLMCQVRQIQVHTAHFQDSHSTQLWPSLEVPSQCVKASTGMLVERVKAQNVGDHLKCPGLSPTSCSFASCRPFALLTPQIPVGLWRFPDRQCKTTSKTVFSRYLPKDIILVMRPSTPALCKLLGEAVRQSSGYRRNAVLHGNICKQLQCCKQLQQIQPPGS